MTLDRIILKDFLTYDELDYNIPRVPMQIQGRNLTEEDQESNGSGKSGILTAIEYCIAASNSRDVRDNELVTFGCEKSTIQLYASCGIRKERLHITWVIKIKGSNKLSIRKQRDGKDWEDVSFSNTNDGKKYILSWFAISKDDLFNYYIVNKQRFKSFFKSSNTDKVALINRFSPGTKIVDGIDNLDTEHLQRQYNIAFANKSRIEGKIESNKERTESENNRDFKKEYEDRLEDINESIELLNEKIGDKNLEIKDVKLDIKDLDEEREQIKTDRETFGKTKLHLKGELDKFEPKLKEIDVELKDAQKQLDDFVSTDFDSERKVYRDQLSGKSEELKEAKNKSNEIKDKETKILGALQQISVKLKGSITCPNCQHEFLLDGDIEKIKENQSKGNVLKSKVEKAKDKSEKLIESINNSMESIRENISQINSREEAENSEKSKLSRAFNEINNRLNTIKSEKQLLENKISKVDRDLAECDADDKEVDLEEQSHNNKVENIKGEIENIKTQIQNKKDSIKDIEIGNNKDTLKELDEERVRLATELEEKSKEVIQIESDIAERNEWANNFKQFKLHIANKSLEVIEYHCNRYLKGMRSDLRVKLEGYKVLASGKIKDEITTKIVRGDERSFSSFSGGEQGRLLFASILANRHMLNSTHPYGGLDFLSVDEVFEGIDSLGLKSLIHSAKQLEIAVLVVTHVTDENVSDDVLLIEKINGVSRIKNG